MDLEDYIDLLGDAERALRKRKRATADASEKRALEVELRRIRDMQDFADLVGLTNVAANLNAVAGVIEAATAALRARPFDNILGAYQDLLDRIGSATGQVLSVARNASADDTPPADAEAATPNASVAVATDDAAGGATAQLAGLYQSMTIRSDKLAEIDHFWIAPISANRSRYEQVGAALGIPWYFIAAIHGLESSFNFETHLHNGDPLTARTVHVPAGHPRSGQPPFTWIDSAIDAMRLKDFDGLADWSIGTTLDRLERYNGLGYRNRGLPSPYLWSYSNHYEKGKFVADRVFDPEAVSKQCGAAVTIKRLEQRGMLDLARPLETTIGRVATLSGTRPATAAGEALDLPPFVRKTAEAELAFPGTLANGARDRGGKLDVHRVQEWCSFHRAVTAIDGHFGDGTERAVRTLQNDQGLPETGTVDEATWAAMVAPMHRALAGREHPPETSIYTAVLAVAQQHLAEHPIEFQASGQGNIGPWVRLYMLGKQGSSQPWCAGFVSHIIGQAAHDLGVPVPIPRQVGVDALVGDAKADDRFVAEGTVATGTQRLTKIPKGAIFCVRRTSTDWTHTGIVTDPGKTAFSTIEGNTNDEGSREGFEVCARSRAYGDKDFVLLG